MRGAISISILFFLLLLSYYGYGQKVFFYGNIFSGNRIKKMYYRFENEKFDTGKYTYSNFQEPDANGDVTTYRIGFNMSELLKHDYLYFSTTIADIRDSAIRDQNRINLKALLKFFTGMPGHQHAILANDLFPDNNFMDLTGAEKNLPGEAHQYQGKYAYEYYIDHIPRTIELGDGGIFYTLLGKPGKQPYLLNEIRGRWKPGVDSSGRKVCHVYGLIKYNRDTGTKMKADSSESPFDLFILGNGSLGIYNPAPTITTLRKL